MGYTYTSVMWAWIAIPPALFALYLVLVRVIVKASPLKRHTHRVKVEMVFASLAELLYMPFGINLARAFHCTTVSTSQTHEVIFTKIVEVDNSLACESAGHYALQMPAGIAMVLVLVGMPYMYYRQIRSQVYADRTIHHEVYVQLKEAEYANNTDMVWATRRFFLFASFRRRWAYQRVLKLGLKALMIALFALLYDSDVLNMANASAFVLGAYFGRVMWKKQYRVKKFDHAARLLYLSNVVVAVILLFYANKKNSYNKMIEEPAVQIEVLGAVGLGFLAALLMTAFLGFKELRGNSPWPVLFHPKDANRGVHPYPIPGVSPPPARTSNRPPLLPFLQVKRSQHISEFQAKQNQHHMQVVYRGRELIEACNKSSGLLMPTHDLGRYIFIVNDLVRKTNRDNDAMHYALWGLLDELVELHNRYCGVSIFSMTEKRSTAKTARALLEIVPALTSRLKRREYEWCLLEPRRRRILFKLFVLRTFMNRDWWKR